MIGILAPKKETVTSHTRHDLRHNGGRGADNPLPRSLSLHLRAIIPWRDDLRNLGLIAGATTDRLVPHSRQGRSIRGNGTHWDEFGSAIVACRKGRFNSFVFCFFFVLAGSRVCLFVRLSPSLSLLYCLFFIRHHSLCPLFSPIFSFRLQLPFLALSIFLIRPPFPSPPLFPLPLPPLFLSPSSSFPSSFPLAFDTKMEISDKICNVNSARKLNMARRRRLHQLVS